MHTHYAPFNTSNTLHLTTAPDTHQIKVMLTQPV
jgi:hypothetical protein